MLVARLVPALLVARLELALPLVPVLVLAHLPGLRLLGLRLVLAPLLLAPLLLGLLLQGCRPWGPLQQELLRLSRR